MTGIKTYDTFSVGRFEAIFVGATPERQAKILNMSGGKLFYKTAADVDTGDTEVPNGASVTTEVPLWIISETSTKVLVEHLEGPTVHDLTVNDKLTAKGEAEIDGDLNHDGSKVGFYGKAPASQAAKLTAADAGTVDGTYGADEEKVLKNVRTRLGEIETALVNLGLLKAE